MPTQISGSTGVSKVQSVDVTTLSDKTKCDFTGIPSWVKRITVMFNGVSTSGTSVVQVQLGAGSVDATGYNGNVSGGPTAGYYTIGQTTGFPLNFTTSFTATTTLSGAVQFLLIGSNTWVAFGSVAPSTSPLASLSGSKTLSGTLDRIRITTVNGTDTFDAGSINIMYEG